MKKIIVVIPHSHTWFWSEICLASLVRNPPRARGYEVGVIMIDNSPWSPAIKGVEACYWDVCPFDLSIIKNYKSNKFHASALDCVVESFPFDYLMAMETDVLALRPDWLQWFVDQMRETDFAVGMWHHEHFVNPSCTLYRGETLREVDRWCKGSHYFGNDKDHVIPPVPSDELRWGENFGKTAPLDNNLPLTENPAEALSNIRSWIAGPFAEKRGFAEGTVLKESPSGQLKGGGWYEPGQQLHAWAVQAGYTYTICQTHTHERHPGLPVQTMYGTLVSEYPESLSTEMSIDQMVMKGAQTVHLWGGTRALDIIKHPVTCNFVKSNTPYWLAREARFWREVVSQDVQAQTLDLIRKYGWHITGQGSDHVTERDREAAAFVRECYREGGVEW